MKEAKVVGIGVEKGRSMIYILVDGKKIAVLTNLTSFALLAQMGVPVIQDTSAPSA